MTSPQGPNSPSSAAHSFAGTHPSSDRGVSDGGVSDGSASDGSASRSPDVDGSATESSRYPLRHDFSCREPELQLLRALMRRCLAPSELRPEDSAAIAEVVDESPGDGNFRPIALVRGASGMGKSRLLSEAKAEAQASGFLVKEVFCYERQGVPLLPVLRVVKELLHESTEREQLWETYSPVLARLFPELGSELGLPSKPMVLAGEEARIHLFDSLFRLLGDLSREKSLLILIHDLHRSDRSTVDFLEYLGRNVFLDESARLREPDVAEPDTDETWKQIRRRDADQAFVSETLGAEGSLSLLDSPEHRVMVIANYLGAAEVALEESPSSGSGSAQRDEEGVQATISALKTQSFVLHRTLPELTAEESGRLLERTLGDATVSAPLIDKLHVAAAGNPLCLVELCRCLIDSGLLSNRESTQTESEALDRWLADLQDAGDEGSSVSRPGGLSEKLVLKRLHHLPELELRLLRLLATLRRPVQLDILDRFVEESSDAVMAAMRQLESHDFVRSQMADEVQRYFLVHEDFVRSIYGEISADEVESLHLAIGGALSKHPRATEPVRTYETYVHYSLSSEPERAIPFGHTAATYFAQAYAADLAVTILNRLLEILPDNTPPAERLPFLAHLSELEFQIKSWAFSKTHVKELLEEGKELPIDERLSAYLLLADIYREIGEPHKGVKVLNRCQKACQEGLDPRRQAQLSARLAQLRLDRQDSKRAINRAIASMKDLEGVDGVETERADLLQVLAAAHLQKGETVAAIQSFQQLLEIVEELGDEVRMARVLNTLGGVYYDRGNYFRAARYLFRALDVIRRLQDLRALSRAYDALGKVYRNSGDNLRGIEYFNRSLRVRERIGDYEDLAPTLNSLGSLHAHTGDYIRAIRFFQKSVENSERFGNTAGIVRAFLHLSRVYLEVGELRQVESLAKQILILSQEFNLLELEGEGHRLQGDLLFLRADFRGAEREFRKAIDIATKRGRKNGHSAAILSLGGLQYEKEEYEEALKTITKGQRLAEEIQSVPLQVRALLLKGNVYRFLKGGNTERAKESLAKGLELVSGESQLPLTWELDYSISKVFQGNLEFVEAAESYRRAERILERIASRLPEDMKVAYLDDRRRKTFFEDYRRFKKEAAGRTSPTNSEVSGVVVSEPVWRLPEKSVDAEMVTFDQSSRVLTAATRVLGGQSAREWAELLLGEARRLVPAPSGFLRGCPEGRCLAATDMGLESVWANAKEVPGAIFHDVCESGKPTRSGQADWPVRLAQLPGGPAYKSRSLIALPISHREETIAVLYLERPSAQNPFSEDEQSLLAHFLDIAGQSYALLRRLDRLCLYREDSPILTWPGFEERLHEQARAHIANGRPFSFVEVTAPGLEAVFDEGDGGHQRIESWIEAGDVAPNEVVHVDADRFLFSYDLDGKNPLEQIAEGLVVRTRELFQSVGLSEPEAVECQLIRPEVDSVASVADLERQIRTQVFRRSAGFDLTAEASMLTNGELTLKEAKTALERRYITAELHKSRGNITRAAESLGIHRPQLSNLIKKHNVRREEFE